MALADVLRQNEVPSLVELKHQHAGYLAAREGFGVRVRSRSQLEVLRALRLAGGVATAAYLAAATGHAYRGRKWSNLVRLLCALRRVGLVRKCQLGGGPGRIVWELIMEGTHWEPPT